MYVISNDGVVVVVTGGIVVVGIGVGCVVIDDRVCVGVAVVV